MIKRRKTVQIRVGGVKIGGDAPVSIQSMTNAETADVKSTIVQIGRLEKAGCEIVRVAVKGFEDAGAIKKIRRKIKIPLVADIHFNYKLALKSIENGADKIRLNPGNLRNEDEIEQVVRAAKKARIPIRIGVNSGSVSTLHAQRATRNALVSSALNYIKLFQALDFHDIIISLKSSNVASTVESYREMARHCDYPLHLGVTATGPYDTGIVKSSVGIGTLLMEGIGDTIRVSLTADPTEEVVAAKRILSACGIRRFGPDIISCPTCGRCQVDLITLVNELERQLSVAGSRLSVKRPISIALMGCEVNGPGEAREADVGIAFGKNSGMLFRKGKIIKKIAVKNAVNELIKLIA